jgi:hypothetical protein
VTKLGYVPDGDDEDMYNERKVEVEVENVPEAMADEASIDEIDTRCPETKAKEAKEDQATLLKKRSA